ncbi:class I SAM-dependent methyltransferase [Ectothiorhodospiraceae bacterium 2226]|nr:class I SAM-dependent methyltransferase [Ectothiorhodospiraceae bacterium 2226]
MNHEGDHIREKWDERYRRKGGELGSPARVLRDHAHLLPEHGLALDLACGLAANAFFLAEHGLTTHAWDISEVAVERVRELAAQRGVTVHANIRDVTVAPPAPASFDVIVVSRFLERDLAPALVAALRPGGLLFYQTYTRTRASDPEVEEGPTNPQFRLGDNELLRLFAPLRVLAYREEGAVAGAAEGLRDEALLVAQRPPEAPSA